jgi:hypothetical protein
MSFIINPFVFSSALPPLPLMANLVGWWRADSLNLSDGVAVGGTGQEWHDESGLANDLVQATLASRPIFHTNIFGTKPAVYFQTSSRSLNLTNTITLGGQLTILCVGKFDNDSLIFTNPGVNMQVRIFRTGANNNSWFAGVGEVVSDLFGTAASVVRQNVWRRDGANNVAFRENKTARGGGADTGTLLATSMGSSSFGTLLDGYVAEVCVWNTAQTLAGLDAQYDSYMQPRWNLP